MPQKGGLPLAHENRDPWEVLDISPTPDPAKIRDAYLAQVRRHHPDQYRQDPTRYHQQEEQMKVINEAYRRALEEPPADLGTGGRQPLVTCPVHQQPSERHCRRCKQPLCVACSGYRQSLCHRHYQQARIRRARGRAFKEWGPLIGLIVVLRAVGLPGLYTGLAVLAYLAAIGLRLLLTRRWFGCLAMLLLPYSLVLAGIWSLFESLRDWNRPAAERSWR